MADKNPYEPKVVLPIDWKARLDSNGHPTVRLTKSGVEYSLKNPDDREVLLALVLEHLNGHEQYKKGREEIFLQLLVAQAHQQGREDPDGPFDPFEQDSLVLTMYLWIREEPQQACKLNTHELRKKLLAKAQGEGLDIKWWPTTLNWFSKRVADRTKTLQKIGVLAKRLADESRSWEICVERKEQNNVQQ